MHLSKPYYHPNALPSPIREQLPDPCRPIDAPVVPASMGLFKNALDPLYQALADSLTPQKQPLIDIFPKPVTLTTLLDFLKTQRENPLTAKSLTLAYFIKLVRPLSAKLIETLLVNQGDFYANQTTARMQMLAELGQNLVALYLMSLCKTRKTLNHELTLQRLTEQMNRYIAQHPCEIAFLTYDNTLAISPNNVAFAILALDGKLSKKGTMGERVTNVSSQNFLATLNSF